MEKEINHVLPFLDVLLDNKAPQFPVTTTYRKKTFMDVLTNFFWFYTFLLQNRADQNPHWQDF